jgi:glycosyltransferase involved in cell wall biosynthesis
MAAEGFEDQNVAAAIGSAAGAPRISVVIPALNEEKNLLYTLPRIPPWVDEIILVDGHSTDNTVAVAKSIVPDIVIVEEDRPGKGAALRCGFEAARGDIIVSLDADGSTDPVEIPAFVGLLLAGADFVKGSRFIQGAKTDDMEWYRFLGNWALVKLVRLGFGGRFTDLCYGFNAFWRDILPLLSIEDASGFEIETSMNVQALRAGLRVAEVPSWEHRRLSGVSNLRTIPDGWRVLSTIVRLGLTRAAADKTPSSKEKAEDAIFIPTTAFDHGSIASRHARPRRG